MTSHLIIPGLGSSGPDHWQSWVETVLPNASRVRQWNWHDADLPVWSARIRHQLSRAIEDNILIAHSFGALAAAQAAIDLPDSVAGVLLVAPADPVHFRIDETSLLQPLGVPAIVVASASDKWMSIERAKHFACHWGAGLINLGDAGHINAEAGYGDLARCARLGPTTSRNFGFDHEGKSSTAAAVAIGGGREAAPRCGLARNAGEPNGRIGERGTPQKRMCQLYKLSDCDLANHAK